MTPWEWDEKGHFWFNRETGEELTPQELMRRYVDQSTALRLLVEVVRCELELTSAKAELVLVRAGSKTNVNDVRRFQSKVSDCQIALDKAIVTALENEDVAELLGVDDEA